MPHQMSLHAHLHAGSNNEIKLYRGPKMPWMCGYAKKWSNWVNDQTYVAMQSNFFSTSLELRCNEVRLYWNSIKILQRHTHTHIHESILWKAKRKQTHRARERLTQWHCKLAQDATADGNQNDICRILNPGIILPLSIRHHHPLHHCFCWTAEIRRNTKTMEKARKGESKRERVTESLAKDHCRLQPSFVFIRKIPSSQGRVWRTALCLPFYYVIPISRASALCSSTPSYSKPWKYIFPHCIQTSVCHSPHAWRRNENHRTETHTKKANLHK